MCGFTVTNKNVNINLLNNRLVSLRGPDKTSLKEINQYKFCHHLLSITGEITEQPFVSNNIVAIYNGEIYNYDFFIDKNLSDGHSIIPLYEKYDIYFPQKINGEFALFLIDFNKRIIVLSSDIFKTKPIFFSVENKEISVSSYKSALKQLGCQNIIEMDPNTTLIFDFEGNLKSKIKVFNFDIKNQDKKEVNSWIESFDRAVQTRAKTNKNIFIGLSSGYDSGAICCSLLKNNNKFKVFSVMGSENDDILNKRFALLEKYVEIEKIIKSQEEYEINNREIKENTDNFLYSIRNKEYSYTEYIPLHDDGGSNWLNAICRRAKNQNYKVILSGMGADEIVSDYGFNGKKHYPHSNFGGKFPDNLEEIFPWPSFYDSTMRSYIAKEEYVGGSHGIETRYPFLDKMVVQEFLWLHPSIKNSCYKSVISYYLEKNNFPFEKGVKRGF